MKHQVLLFYKYITIDDPMSLAARVRERGDMLSLKGRVIVAQEGINGTLEGETAATEEFALWLQSDARLSDMNVKRSQGTGEAFLKLKVKVRGEIVGTRFPSEVDPRVKTAPYLAPSQLHEWYEKAEEFVVVDMRNDYEFESGHFKNSISLDLQNSRDLPERVHTIANLKEKKVVTVCTGGIRCEKMSALLQHEGFTDVYQLENGIHAYMEQYPGQDFKGTLYTFDQRKTMHFGAGGSGKREMVGKCYHCAAPSERYVNCANTLCHFHYIACYECSPNDAEAYCAPSCKELKSTKVPAA